MGSFRQNTAPPVLWHSLPNDSLTGQGTVRFRTRDCLHTLLAVRQAAGNCLAVCSSPRLSLAVLCHGHVSPGQSYLTSPQHPELRNWATLGSVVMNTW